MVQQGCDASVVAIFLSRVHNILLLIRDDITGSYPDQNERIQDLCILEQESICPRHTMRKIDARMFHKYNHSRLRPVLALFCHRECKM